MTATSRGLFLTLEGGEGAGKSTQTRLLAARLRAAGIDPLETREPGGSPGAEDIRGLLVTGEPGRWDAMTELLLMTAARRDHVERSIRPALDVGRWVLCDRFVDSTLAYQGYGQGLGADPVMTLHSLAVAGLIPDLTLWLDLPVAQGLERAGRRQGAGDRFERFGAGFHERVRAGFAELAARSPERVVRIDASRSEDQVAEDIWQSVATLVPERP